MIIYQCLSIIFQALKNAFSTAQTAFTAVGLDWAAVVGGLAVMSMVLRSFFRVFVGDSMDMSMVRVRGDFATAAKNGRYAKNASHRKTREHGKFERRGRVQGNRVNTVGSDGYSTYCGNRLGGRGGYVIGNKGYTGEF